MASDIRIVLKNFNRDLLIEELAASALPFITANLYGFERLNRFVGAPASAPRLISGDGNNPANNDFAQPGEIRFEFTTALTIPEGTALDNLLTAHDSTQRTNEQQRQNQDQTDVDTLIANFPNFDRFSNAQFRAFVKLLARVVLRDRRTPPI